MFYLFPHVAIKPIDRRVNIRFIVTMISREQNGNGKEARILTAAQEVFGRRGFHQARMAQVASRAGVSKGLPFWYFKTKQALFREVIQGIFAADLDGMEALLRQPGTVRNRLRAYVKQQWTDLKRFALILPLIRDFYAMMQTDRQLRDLFQTHFEKEKSLVLELLRQGEARGELNGADAETAAETLLSLQEGLFLRWAIKADSENMIRQADFAVGVVLDRLEKTGG